MQEFYGCGKFTSDSYRIFCRGDLSSQASRLAYVINSDKAGTQGSELHTACSPLLKPACWSLAQPLRALADLLVTYFSRSGPKICCDARAFPAHFLEPLLCSCRVQGVEDVNLRRYLRWANTGDAEEKEKPHASAPLCSLLWSLLLLQFTCNHHFPGGGYV